MESRMNVGEHFHINLLNQVLNEKAPFFSSIIDKRYKEFGDDWIAVFENDMSQFFNKDANVVRNAVTGYIKFALDGMLLQKRFDKTREYAKKSYSDAAAEVYQNRDYMNNLYLPGILLSHFLWRHHYLQHKFYMEEFLPLVHKHGGKEFYDIGVGTGFYSKEMLRCTPGMIGTGYDLSEFSLEYTTKMLRAWKLSDRYTTKLQDIITTPVTKTVPFIINIEVLEHLEDPLTFLKALYNMMEFGGYGLISAAITAPNADHIYLYNSVHEVIDQIEEAGFKVLKFVEDEAYEPETSENSVPKNAAIIVTK